MAGWQQHTAAKLKRHQCPAGCRQDLWFRVAEFGSQKIATSDGPFAKKQTKVTKLYDNRHLSAFADYNASFDDIK